MKEQEILQEIATETSPECAEWVVAMLGGEKHFLGFEWGTAEELIKIWKLGNAANEP